MLPRSNDKEARIHAKRCIDAKPARFLSTHVDGRLTVFVLRATTFRYKPQPAFYRSSRRRGSGCFRYACVTRDRTDRRRIVGAWRACRSGTIAHMCICNRYRRDRRDRRRDTENRRAHVGRAVSGRYAYAPDARKLYVPAKIPTLFRLPLSNLG